MDYVSFKAADLVDRFKKQLEEMDQSIIEGFNEVLKIGGSAELYSKMDGLTAFWEFTLPFRSSKPEVGSVSELYGEGLV